jgi:hypothetical protein
MPTETPHLVAGDDISPACFVTLITSANRTVNESNASDKILMGITHEDAKATPISGSSDLHAAAGDPVHLHTAGEICYLQIDSAGCTAGDYLKPDNSGNGDVASTGDEVGALALETVAASEKCMVLVLPPGFQMP